MARSRKFADFCAGIDGYAVCISQGVLTPDRSISDLPSASREQRKVRLLEAITRKINLGASLEETFELIYDRLRDFVPYNRIAIALVDAEGSKLGILAARSDGKVVLGKGYSGSIRGSSLEPLIREGSIRIINDLQEYLANKPSSDSTRLIVKEGMRSSLTLPLLMEGKPVGVMFFSSRHPGVYGPEHEEFLKNIVGHVAIAVERARLVDGLRERTEYLENILQHSLDAIIVLDPQHRIRTWNQGARGIFGFTADETVGRSIDLLKPGGDPNTSLSSTLQEAVARNGSVRRLEVALRNKRQELRTVEMTGSPLKDRNDRLIGHSWIARDVTDVKAMQGELLRTHGLAVVGEMAATVAHEIKNPLAGISGAIQVLAEGMPKGDNRREIVGEVLDQVRRLDRTVRDLLNFARPMTPVRQGFDLVDSLQSAWKTLASQSEAKAITFEILPGTPAEIHADPQLLRQVWINLFQNAIEAMPDGGSVAVRLAGGDPLRVEIRDTGAGIGGAAVANLWKPFYTTKTRGTGLGLSIIKKIIDAHGGRIWCESVPAKGTTFFVEIPR